VHDIFDLEAVALFDADLHKVYQAGYWNVDPQEMAQNVYYFETTDDEPEIGIGRRVVRLGAVPIGSLVVRGDTSPLTNNAIASLIAITFDRYRAFANESRIETERRTEQLRATVLDSLAHAYKTPLTEMGRLSPGQSELVSLIDEQTSVLADLTTRLLTTARLDAGDVAIHVERVNAGTLVEEVVSSLKERLASMKVAIEIADEDLVLKCDRQLIVMLLTQYIDNACKYANFGTTITIRVLNAGAEAIFSVHSFGPVIPMADRERIFDRYYRSSGYANRAPGTGIGLSVAKRAAQIHGGYVWVTSDEQEGTTFFAAIPLTAGKETS
jgi:two-component system sensor histidine kinase KdpD